MTASCIVNAMKPSLLFRRPYTRDAFTLVELMVTMVIVAMLAALMLSGLARARERAKADKTRSTIRKLHEIIIPQYEGYLTRRIKPPATLLMTPMRCVTGGVFQSGAFACTLATGASSDAINRLWAKRLIMALEMPDQWNDVMTSGVTTSIPQWTLTAPVRRYAAYKAGLTNRTDAYESAECLAMIVTRGGFDPNAIEAFRNDEVGDYDQDGAPEFRDGWGSPVAFIRLPSGYEPLDPSIYPDSFDPMRVSNPVGSRTEPLIYSPGPDESLNSATDATSSVYGLISSAGQVPDGWVSTLVGPGPIGPTRISTRNGTSWAGADGSAADAARDNITNRDLSKK